MTDWETSDRHGPDDEAIEELLRHAERREPPPAERGRRVRSAVRASWEEVVARRRSRRRQWILLNAAALLLLAGLPVFLWLHAGPAPEVGRIASLTPSVWLDGGGEAAAPRLAGVVSIGDRIRTGADGRVAVLLESGESIRLDRDSSLLVVSGTRLDLEGGAVYVDSGAEATGGLEIRTPLGAVRDVGTQFEVRLSPDAIRVRVREGLVIVDGDAQVEAGQEMRRGVDGAGTWAAVAPHGAEWDWVASIAPTPDFAGWNARQFLDWVAREKGWVLQFSDLGIAGVAGDTTIRGSLQGLTPDDLLDAVLPACGLEYRVVEGRLIVSAPSPGDETAPVS